MLSLPLRGVGRAPIPGSVKTAAVLAVAQAGLTGAPSVVYGLAIFQENPWHPAAMVLAAQLVAAVLLIIGTVRLVLGGGRSALVAGAGLDLLLCVVYIVYGAIVLPRNDITATQLIVVVVALAVFLAVLPAVLLGLALSGRTTEYLRLTEREARYRPE